MKTFFSLVILLGLSFELTANEPPKKEERAFGVLTSEVKSWNLDPNLHERFKRTKAMKITVSLDAQSITWMYIMGEDEYGTVYLPIKSDHRDECNNRVIVSRAKYEEGKSKLDRDHYDGFSLTVTDYSENSCNEAIKPDALTKTVFTTVELHLVDGVKQKVPTVSTFYGEKLKSE